MHGLGLLNGRPTPPRLSAAYFNYAIILLNICPPERLHQLQHIRGGAGHRLDVRRGGGGGAAQREAEQRAAVGVCQRAAQVQEGREGVGELLQQLRAREGDLEAGLGSADTLGEAGWTKGRARRGREEDCVRQPVQQGGRSAGETTVPLQAAQKPHRFGALYQGICRSQRNTPAPPAARLRVHALFSAHGSSQGVYKFTPPTGKYLACGSNMTRWSPDTKQGRSVKWYTALKPRPKRPMEVGREALESCTADAGRCNKKAAMQSVSCDVSVPHTGPVNRETKPRL